MAPLQPYIEKKHHTIYGLDKDADMIQYAMENNSNENYKWMQIGITEWVDSKESILPPRKLLSVHSLHTVEDYR